MTMLQKIIKGLSIFEKYNANTHPTFTGSKAILMVQEEEFLHISKKDRKLLESYGWHNEPTSPYLWKLYR